MSRAADPVSERFSGMLLRYRGRTALTQRELAARVGVSRRVVQNWEAGVNVPSADRLQKLIVVLFEAGALTVGRETVEARTLWAAALGEISSRLRRPLDEDWLAEALAQRAPQGELADTSAPPEIDHVARRQDWGEAPDVIGFVGRATELEACRTWVVEENCRVLALLGIGGIGKTALAAHLAQDVAANFQFLYWRSLRDALPSDEWLAGAIGFLSEHQLMPPPREAERVTMLLQLLRERRSLLVLDNFETLLEPGQYAGGYRADSAGYGSLLQAVGVGRHQSCLVLTSREAPPELTGLGGGALRTLELSGLGLAEGRVLLAHNQLAGTPEEWASLINRFGGNGLALKVVGERIHQLFGGEIGAFLEEESSSVTVFGGIRRLLSEQIERGSPLQQEVLRTLAAQREPVRLTELLAEFGPVVGRGAVLDTVEALRRRSLLERVETDGTVAFTLQPVVLEYVTDWLVEAVSDEIVRGGGAQLTARPLVKAQAKEYVRYTQERLIGAPILQLLNAQYAESGTRQKLLAQLEDWRARPLGEHGYGPGNVVNLLRLLRGGDLRGLDFSGLSLRQAYLAGVQAQDANLARTHLVEVVLAEAFPPPSQVALSADGAVMAVGTSTGDIWLFRVADRTALLTIQGHSMAVWGIVLSRDGRLVASGSSDGTIRLWEVTSGRLQATLQCSSHVLGLVLSADERLLASGHADGTVRLWEVPSGRPLATIHGHTNTVRAVVLSADGKLLASGSADGTVRFWDVQSQRPLNTVLGHTGPIWGLALATNRQLLASGGADATVRLWEIPSGRSLATFHGHTGAVWGVALSADGQLLVSSSGDCTVRLWDVPSGSTLATLQGHTGAVRGVALPADGRTIASSSADGTVRLWEARTGRSQATLQGSTSAVFDMSLAATGQVLAISYADGAVRLFDIRSRRVVATLRSHSRMFRSVALSREGRLVACGGVDGTVGLWEVPDGRELVTMSGHNGSVFALAFAGDGRLLASSSSDGTVRLWEVPSGRLLATIQGHTGAVRGVALSADGRQLATGGADGTVRLWDAPSGRALATLHGHAGAVWGVALSADGRQLASGSDDMTVRIWEQPNQGLTSILQGHTSTVIDVAMSASGRLLASGSADGTVRLWEVPSGRLLATLRGHTSMVIGVALSTDGGLLASGSGDGEVKLWETDGGTCVGTLRSEPCYARMEITGVTGVTAAQRAALLALGAIEQPPPVHEGATP
jgi:WD40 repeat protein/transcriptional regulator with XRE-family HTH domain